MSFLWIPGTGPDEDALARMRAYLTRPAEPMGEAWFMSKERKLHHELAALGAANIPLEQLYSALEDIASGTRSFGHFEEWDAWLPYMLPDLISRSHERYAFDFLFETTVTAFMAIYWTGTTEEYPGFTRDVHLTLGHVLMKPELWAPDPHDPADTARRIPLFLLQEDRGEEQLYGWGSSNAPGSLAAAMAFCLKYLPEDDLRPWAATLFNIEHPHWRFAILVWYVGAQSLGTKPMLSARDFEQAAPGLKWENSHILKSTLSASESEAAIDSGFNHNRDFLDAGRVRVVLDAMREQITVDRLGAWEATFWMDPLLAAEPALPAILNRALATLAA